MKKLSLNKFFDKGIWISEDRIASFISSDNSSIKQIDFHGCQPVSRNARIFMHQDYVLKFFIKIFSNGEFKIIEIPFYEVIWNPNKIISRLEFENIFFDLQLSLAKNTLICDLIIDNKNEKTLDYSFEIILNLNSITKEVHGNRTSETRNLKDNFLQIKINDKIELEEWIKRKGDYQGDFLIPEHIRRMIFKNQKISGTACYDDLKDNYKNSNFLIYNSDIFVYAGGKNFNIINNDTKIIFQYDSAARKDIIDRCNPFLILFSEHEYEVEQVFKKLENLLSELKLLDEKYLHLKNSLPEITIKNQSSTSDLFKTIPIIVESAVIRDYDMIRACSSSYYWIWAWDSMVTAANFSFWNNSRLQNKIIDFIQIHRDIDKVIPQQWTRALEPMDNKYFGVHDFLLSLITTINYYTTGNDTVIKNNYSDLTYAFMHLYNSCDRNGFFKTIGMYPDLPLKTGRKVNGYTTMEESSFFSFAILLHTAAFILNDNEILDKTKEIIIKLLGNFIDRFYDEHKGFLVDSIDENFIHNKTYPIYSLLFILNSSGLSLIRNKIEEISEFIYLNHFSENGIRMVPEWDKNRMSESVLSGWYPFWDSVVIKLFRRTGNSPAIKRWLNTVKRCYEYFGFCPEFISLKDDDIDESGWKSRGTPWNLNCSSGWYRGIIEGIFGIEEDIGGITYISSEPVETPLKLNNIFLHGIRSDLEISGSGSKVALFEVNNDQIIGILKVPQKYYNTDKMRIRIVHCSDIPDICITELNGASVIDISKNDDEIKLVFSSYGFFELVFESEKKPDIYIDDVPITFIWADIKLKGWFNSFYYGIHNLLLKTGKKQ